MRTIDITKLIEWLGPDGAIAGLEGSDFMVSELYEIATSYDLAVEKKMKRTDLINEHVNCKTVTIEKTTDELLSMNQDDLKNYLEGRKVSITELLNLLSQLGIRPSSKDKLKLVDFAAREISGLGMYQRVAKGTRGR